jgi:hypothetical protein
MMGGGFEPAAKRPAARAEERHEREAARAGAEAASGAAVGALSAVAALTLHRAAAELIVPDDSDVGPGQMRRADFLSELRGEVCAAADDALRSTGRSSAGCPEIEHWFGVYGGRDAASIERAVRRYAPETAGAVSARDYVGAVVARVRSAIVRWTATGELTGVPDVATLGLEGLAGAAAATLGGTGVARSISTGELPELPLDAVEPGEPVLRKDRDGAAVAGNAPSDAAAVHAQLGRGTPLPAAPRTRMETAFGRSFGGVRIHADAGAAGIADRIGARAFTVGSDVGFAAGQFRPGTLDGDALLAHELAHTVQQVGGSGAAGVAALEADADAAALTILAGGAPRIAGVTPLALQRCRSGASNATVQTAFFEALSDPNGRADAVIAQIDEANDAAAALDFFNDSYFETFARYPGGRRIVQRAQQAFADGNVAQRSRARAMQAIIDRYAATPAAPSAAEQAVLDRINAAVNAEPPERRALYASGPQPLVFPVELYRRGREEAGHVYYDPSMPAAGVGTGAAGETPASTRTLNLPAGRQLQFFGVEFIRIGPRALSSDATIRTTIYHEYGHYRMQVDRRGTIADPDLAQLRTDVLANASTVTSDEDMENTSHQVVDDFTRLGDAEIAQILWYWGHRYPTGTERFRRRTLNRIVAFAPPGSAEARRLLRIISTHAETRTGLEPLVAALTPPAPARPARPPGRQPAHR